MTLELYNFKTETSIYMTLEEFIEKVDIGEIIDLSDITIILLNG